MALQSLARPPSNENFQWALTDSNRRPSACKAEHILSEQTLEKIRERALETDSELTKPAE